MSEMDPMSEASTSTGLLSVLTESFSDSSLLEELFDEVTFFFDDDLEIGFLTL